LETYHSKEYSDDLDENPNSSHHFLFGKYSPDSSDFLMNKLKTCHEFV
jgi:hypothetical protein